jgi:hypothetical protein
MVAGSDIQVALDKRQLILVTFTLKLQGNITFNMGDIIMEFINCFY